MGASGAMEALATIFALHEQTLPATAGVAAADPALDIHLITGAAQSASISMALSNSFAFGGLNAVLALRIFSTDTL